MNLERRKIEFLTNAVGSFRGLPMMIFGLAMTILMILNYAAELDSQKENSPGKDLTAMFFFVLICLIILAVGYPKISRWFGGRFGRTKAKAKNFQALIVNLLCTSPLLIAFFLGTSSDVERKTSFSLTILLIAISAFLVWLMVYRGVSNGVLYFSLLLFAVSFLPWQQVFLAVTVADDFYAEAAFYRAAGSILMGTTYAMMGFTDHRILTAMLQPPKREEEIYESV